jgi:ferric-dicitrate binding protein FerR (iron transport regulator)
MDRYLAGQATPAEEHAVEAWLDGIAKEDNGWTLLEPPAQSTLLSTLYQRIRQTITRQQTPIITMRPLRTWTRWAAAAAIVTVVAIGVILNLTKGDKDRQQVSQLPTDIAAPTETRPVITLADGRKIYLDSADNGTLVQQDGVDVVKNNQGGILYQATNNNQQSTVLFNTLFNPRGSNVVSLTLADGTKVWLNAESSLKYPTAFNGNIREVEITGEAYFEVAHNTSKPFIVSKGQVSVQVLGTHFNVNAYGDEKEINVTLLEGLIEVKNQDSKVQIKPGEQAKVTSDIKVIKDVDVDAIMAWKNGMFALKGADLLVLMRQISRWYDVDIEIQGRLPDNKFGGLVSRQVNLSNVLDALKEYGIKSEFKEGKVLIK